MEKSPKTKVISFRLASGSVDVYQQLAREAGTTLASLCVRGIEDGLDGRPRPGEQAIIERLDRLETLVRQANGRSL